MEDVELKRGIKEEITDEHLEALYSIIAVEDRPVRKFTSSYYIDDNPDIDPDPVLLSRSFNRLEEVTAWVNYYGEKLTAVLKCLVEEESRLKKLRFVMIDDPRHVQNLDQNLVRRAKEQFGDFM